jgi:SLT domain-containing protein
MNPVEIYILLKRAGFMPDEATTMVAVAMAESGGRPAVVNSTGEYSTGLFQINTDPRANDDLAYMDLTDPLQNAQAAKIVYDRQGLQAWTVTHQDKGLK